MIKDIEGLGTEDKFRSLADEVGGFFEGEVEIGMPRTMERIPRIGSIESQWTGTVPDTGVSLE